MRKLKEIKLCIVVGHSFKRPGARNKSLNVNEYALNNELANKLADLCEERDIPYVLHYRLNGYSKLPYEINKLNPTHTICVHHNAAYNKKIQGTETLYYKKSKVSDKFAKCVNDEMVNTLKFKDRGIKPKVQGDNGGHVLKNTSMPCILLEPYFMSEDEAVVNRKPKELAEAILDGYLQFIKDK